MKYGYARVSTDGQSVDAQVRQLIKAGCKKSFAKWRAARRPIARSFADCSTPAT
jgi:DNA invertase Pin-like site-specific DNA recombinase